jgi:uncharacterized membrane protein
MTDADPALHPSTSSLPPSVGVNIFVALRVFYTLLMINLVWHLSGTGILTSACVRCWDDTADRTQLNIMYDTAFHGLEAMAPVCGALVVAELSGNTGSSTVGSSVEIAGTDSVRKIAISDGCTVLARKLVIVTRIANTRVD